MTLGKRRLRQMPRGLGTARPRPRARPRLPRLRCGGRRLPRAPEEEAAGARPSARRAPGLRKLGRVLKPLGHLAFKYYCFEGKYKMPSGRQLCADGEMTAPRQE